MSTITLITGAPGAGKSTISKLLANRFGKCLIINVDELRGMMTVGASTPDRGWTSDAYTEFRLARSVAIYMARLYANEGIDVIVDDPCVPEDFAENYEPLFKSLPVGRVLLLPNCEAVRARLAIRGNPWDHVLINKIGELYLRLSAMDKEGWIVIDSSEWSIERTLTEVIVQLHLS